MSIITTPELITDQSIIWTSVATNPSGSTRVAINNASVYGWGDNSSGQMGAGSFTNDYPSLIAELNDGSTYVKVACGDSFCAFLTSTGEVKLMGNLFDINGIDAPNQTATLPQPNGNLLVSNIFCGPHSAFLITSNGSLFVVGRNTATNGNSLGTGVAQHSTPFRIGDLVGWTKVSSDGNHTLAVNAGSLYAWGDNTSGQLGTGNITPSSTPIPVNALGGSASWSDVSASNGRSAGIFNSFLYTWGDNTDNTIAQPTSVGGIVNIPTPVSLGGDFLDDCDSVSISTQHGLFVRTGNIYAWGSNDGALTGLGLTSGLTASPEIVDSTRNWIAVQSSNGLNVALAVGSPPFSELYSWGFNTSYGTAAETQVGIFNNPNPVPSFGFTTPTQDYLGGAKFDISEFAMVYEGELYTWGSNTQAAGGRGDNIFSTRKAEKISGFGRLWTKCAQGMGIYDGRLYTWGPNTSGLTLTGSTSGFKSVPTEPVSSGTGWIDVTVAGGNALGIRNGQLVAWGSNLNGVTGTLNASNTLTPVTLDTRTDWHQVSMGIHGMAAAIRNGRLYVWGDNTFLGITPIPSNDVTVPTEIDNSTAWQWVSVGNRFTLAIKNGTLYSWGMNESGKTGLGLDSGVTSLPTQVGTFTDWIKVHAGDSHCIGLRANGEIYVWGANLGNSLGVDSGPDYFNPPVLTPTRVGVDNNWTNVYAFLFTPAIQFAIKNVVDTWQPLPAHVPEPVTLAPRVYATGYTDTAGTGNTAVTGNFELLPSTINRSVNYAASDLSTLFVTQNSDLFRASVGSPTLLNSGGWSFVANKTIGSDFQVGIKNGQLVNPPSLPSIEDAVGTYTAAAVAGGTRTVLAVKNGLLYARGANTSGQTGLGVTSGTTATITQVASGLGTGWTDVAISDSFAACGIFNGQLYAWGSSSNGLTAQGVTGFTNFSAPTLVNAGDTTWTKVSMGANHALAIKNGELYAWGNNSRGQLGLGYYGGTANVPTRIGSFSDWTFCYAGPEVSVAIRNNIAYVWGTNTLGRTGLGAYLGSSSSPIQMPIDAGIVNASVSNFHGVYTLNVSDSATPAIVDQNQQAVKNTDQTTGLILASSNYRTPVVLQVNEFGEMLNAAFTSTINPINAEFRGGGLLINAAKTEVIAVMSRQNQDPVVGSVSANTASITPYTYTGIVGPAIAMNILTNPVSDELFVAYNNLMRLNKSTGAVSSILELTSGPNLNLCTFSQDGRFLWQANGIFVVMDTMSHTVVNSFAAQSGSSATFVPGSNHLLVLNGTTIHFFSYDLSGNLTNLGTATDPNLSTDSTFDICAVRSSVDNTVRLVAFGQDRQRVYDINVASPSITSVSLGSASFTEGVTGRLFRRSPDSRFIFNGGNIFTYSPSSTPMVSRYSGSSSSLQLFGQTSLQIWDWK
jgi:alpha-tubulin suppressor-like RCC1 family protein